jgi:ribosomal peptide maturation radical SAM protein 1
MVDPDEVTSLVAPGDALIVVPPFCEVQSPSLGAHVLQACAQRAGFTVGVLYANMLFARNVGRRWQDTELLEKAASVELVGERLFARGAFGVPPLGRRMTSATSSLAPSDDVIAALLDLEARAERWARELGELLARLRRVPVVGFTTTFQQTAASIAIANALKRVAPDVIVVIGGANCDGDMAYGVAQAAPLIDYVFQGESETSFPRFLAQVADGRPPRERVIAGAPCDDMSSVPMPLFDDYAAEKAAWLTGPDELPDAEVWLPYESSRGCWWGERHHCTFCGLNALGMNHREKSADIVVRDLRDLLGRYPFRRIMMTDNIMPHTYFKTLIPQLAADPLPCEAIFYEQKANITLAKMNALWQAGVRMIQPGVEALSTGLLRLMDKGVQARQNVAMLRYARIIGVLPVWNLLYDFPGDESRAYAETLALMPLLRHLHPPQGLLRLSIDRFSPYFDDPSRYGLSHVEPLAVYGDILPDGCDARAAAYYFTADYVSAARAPGGSEIVAALQREIDTWRELWARPEPPVLSLSAAASGEYVLVDTRELEGTVPLRTIDRKEALALITPRPLGASEGGGGALEAKLAVALDGYYVPLVTAHRDVVALAERQELWEPAAPRAKQPAEVASNA